MTHTFCCPKVTEIERAGVRRPLASQSPDSRPLSQRALVEASLLRSADRPRPPKRPAPAASVAA
jgi:hypothetical protein